MKEMKVIHYFRYISYILTSASYILWYDFLLSSKLPVVLFLGIAAVILNHIYKKYQSNTALIKTMVLLEVIGNIIVLLPTGGISSPYIWYSLNVVIVSAYLLSPMFLLGYISTYLIAFMSYYFIKIKTVALHEFLTENSELFLSYFLIVIAAYLLAVMDKKILKERVNLEKANDELYKANKMLVESMDEITGLYKNVYAFINLRSKEQLSSLIIEYTLKITKAKFAFIYFRTNEGGIGFEADGELSQETKDSLYSAVKNRLDDSSTELFETDMPIREIICGHELIMSVIKTNNSSYGILGIRINGDNGKIIEHQIVDQVRMLASLCAILFESFQYEVLYSNYLISEEQHRIANEIHDGVSQRLFYISCKISDILIKTNKNREFNLEAELHTAQDALKLAIKELRDTIYSNGAEGSEIGAFEDSVRNYIKDIKELNGVNIEVNLQGRFDNISNELKKAVFRIIGEGCGNAIRHGESRNIRLELSENRENICIEIIDDGVGFDLREVTRSDGLGMGLRNMNCLVRSFYGSIDIKSQLYNGTRISVLLPLCCKGKGEMSG